MLSSRMRGLATLVALLCVSACCSAANVVIVRRPDVECVTVEEDTEGPPEVERLLMAEGEEVPPNSRVRVANIIRARPRCPPGKAWIKRRCRRVVRCKPAEPTNIVLESDRCSVFPISLWVCLLRRLSSKLQFHLDSLQSKR